MPEQSRVEGEGAISAEADYAIIPIQPPLPPLRATFFSGVLDPEYWSYNNRVMPPTIWVVTSEYAPLCFTALTARSRSEFAVLLSRDLG